MTTTSDLPGTKSLLPSSTASKQRVARSSFTKVQFSQAGLAKYRPAAFLKARLRNASKLSLLPGPVGLTLDDTFMGRSLLPRCSAGDSFTLGLRVDPVVRVLYPKVDVKHSTSGVFAKENSTTYTRSITIVHTRAAADAKPVPLSVMDQVPVSEDDKLKVELVHPPGLVAGGVEVPAGVQDGNLRGGKDWGKAFATMKKDDQINWDVSLNAVKGVRLTLKYDVSLPAGDHAVQVPGIRMG